MSQSRKEQVDRSDGDFDWLNYLRSQYPNMDQSELEELASACSESEENLPLDRHVPIAKNQPLPWKK